MQNSFRVLFTLAGSFLSAVCFFSTPSFADNQAGCTTTVDTAPQAVLKGTKIAVNEKDTKMTAAQMVLHIREANDIAKEWKSFGHHPFGAVLVAPDNQRVLMRQGNISVVRHAETELARRASEAFSPEYLSKCTLVTTMEPCVMCAGNIYFANIGNVVYGAKEDVLKKLTGTSKMNPTMHLPCKQVFAAGQKTIHVYGPFPELEAELIQPHKGFWK